MAVKSNLGCYRVGSKRDVWIFDYVDRDVPALARIFERRRVGYRALGYCECEPPHDFELMTDPTWDDGFAWEDVEVEPVACASSR